ncbi:hypothetical protein P3S67_031498 [Capsicum chacoense]
MKSPQISTLNSSDDKESYYFPEFVVIESNDNESDYFPEYRKDANCKICMANFNAALDRIYKKPRYKSEPSEGTSEKKSTSVIEMPSLEPIKKLPVARKLHFPEIPVSHSPSTTLSTPKSSSNRFASSSMSPLLNSTARVSFHAKVKRRKSAFRFGVLLMRLIFGLAVVFGLELGFSWTVSGFLKHRFLMEMVKNLSEKSWGLKDLEERLIFLKMELDGVINDGEIASCSPLHSTWKIDQDGLLLNSRCTLYKSNSEELSIWGWPLQTAGLLTAGFSARTYTILSGRLTEWSNGGIGYSIRKANSSWTQQKWSASPVQLDPNTWILEYSRSPLTENGKLVSAVLEFLKFWLRREVHKLKQEFWLSSSFTSQYSDFTGERLLIPT